MKSPLVLHRLVPGKENRFVCGSEIETAFTIKALGPLIRFVYQKANGFGVFEQASHQFRHQTLAEVLVSEVFAQPDALEIYNFGSFRDHVCFENQEIIYN